MAVVILSHLPPVCVSSLRVANDLTFITLVLRIRQLQNVDSVLQRTTIIGVILCFRSLAQEALQDVLDKRIPFLMTSVKDFQQHMPNTQDSAIANIRSQVSSLSLDYDRTERFYGQVAGI